VVVVADFLPAEVVAVEAVAHNKRLILLLWLVLL
jgi:hypothetical protein